MKINIAGVGKVTTALLYNLKDKVEIGYILSRNKEKAEKISKELKQGIPVTYNDSFNFEGILFVGYTDKALPEAKEKLERFVTSNTTVIHFSGFYPSTIFPEKWHPASIHPNCPVIGNEISFKDVPFGIEGNIEIAKKIVGLLEGKPYVIPSESKTHYHLAAVIMSNFTHSLIYLAESIYEDANLPKELFTEVMESLLNNTIKNIKKSGTLKTITGPIFREDIEIINAEMELFCTKFPELCSLYDSFIQVILSMKEKTNEK
ncbi:hypothetical protein SU69_02940 [Thermosipho melanesiensis]|uniref:DUF2520 domain-containing protein n=2 Tax=Thermosipho melanesiensis TaxID=46541 RepID=A6LKJ0_THEM4|nr:Rossmann-like and DUF2520 domain-containing protein [Thermosipho melanesiensis]ABR30441.1 conserved hypothetical protein [Thermosipho melanesiensis BI429]APT73601.1 hypothetical protein BW47_03065 [Thermosipho melanesiensis]OOC37548.1 hypothetical protein SU68_02960 [Thermosipho melanesiensis]OOC39444.1 hypothetical protein SU69_02940 [Thermosipho melanesiensis]OOC39507.1 hypothetical protein SU70_02940 [Thermosipho melanesiensis]